MSDYGARKKARNNTAIYADDPEAVTKLEAKLEALQAEQSDMKKANAHWRKHGTMKGFPGMPDEAAARIDAKMETAYSWVQKNGPYEDWRLQNNNANIRRIRKHIAEIQSTSTVSADDGWAFDGGRVAMNTEYNRVQILFDSKPDEEVRAELKRWGFKWAPSQGAWQRQLNSNGLHAVKQVKCIQPA